MGNGFRSSVGNPAATPFTNGPYNFSESLALEKPLLTPQRYTLYWQANKLLDVTGSYNEGEDFHMMLAGTSAVQADVTIATTTGGLELQTNGGTNDTTVITPHTSNTTTWSDVLWKSQARVIWQATITTGDATSITNVVYWAGLKKTLVDTVASDTDQAYFRFDTGETTWEMVSSTGGNDTETATDVTVVANTAYDLRIEIDSSRKPHFFINNVEKGVGSAIANDVNLIPYIGVKETSTTVGKELIVHNQMISKEARLRS